MSFGMTTRNASGTVTIDETTRLARVLGSVYVPQTNGSLTDSGFSTGVPFATTVLLQSSGIQPGSPTVTFSGTTMSWTYPYSGVKSNVIIVYGVY